MEEGAPEEQGAGSAGGWEAYIGLDATGATEQLEALHQQITTTAADAERLVNQTRQVSGALGSVGGSANATTEQMRQVDTRVNQALSLRQRINRSIAEARERSGSPLDAGGTREVAQANEAHLQSVTRVFEGVTQQAAAATAQVNRLSDALAGVARVSQEIQRHPLTPPDIEIQSPDRYRRMVERISQPLPANATDLQQFIRTAEQRLVQVGGQSSLAEPNWLANIIAGAAGIQRRIEQASPGAIERLNQFRQRA